MFHEAWMEARKVSNSKSDHSRTMVPFDRTHTISYYTSLQPCLLHHFRDVITYFTKLKGHVTLNTSLPMVIHHSCTSTPLYQSAHDIQSALFHQIQRYDWGKI